MFTQPTTQPHQGPRRRRTHCAQVGTYDYLCRTGVSPAYDFTYSHQPFGKVVWHRLHRPA